MTIAWTEVLIRLGVAAVCGAVIGLERERKDWTAGLRTHMMVCVGSALAMLVSIYGFHDALAVGRLSDPSRVAAQVISGIGFIGAGAIIFQKQGIVRGLTTAAGLWTVAAIGLAAGGGMYFAAMATTGIAIFILWTLQPIEQRLTGRYHVKSIRVTTPDRPSSLEVMNRILEDKTLEIINFGVNNEENADRFVIVITFKNLTKTHLSEIVVELNANDNVREVAVI